MPLTDLHQRRIDYLRVSITDRCNLSCLYCKPRSAMKPLLHRDILSYEEILHLVSVAVPLGISRVRVTGGEPLVRRGVVAFLARLTRIDGLDDISLTTNGVLLEDMLPHLVAHAGKPRLNISLDSLDRNKFRRITGMDAWDRVWRGIERAERLGFFPLKINVVPVKGLNDDEIAEFARLTLTRKLHVRFIEFMPIGSRDRWSREACVSSDEVRSVIEREFGPLVPVASASGGPARNYQIPGATGAIGLISPITRHFCDSCRRLRLTADGKIRPCLLSDTEVDIKHPLRHGSDDAELERLLRLALEIKPRQHGIGGDETGQSCFQRTMSRIGG